MNKRVKLFGWRIFAVICLSFMTPMAVLMGDWESWKQIWRKALTDK